MDIRRLLFNKATAFLAVIAVGAGAYFFWHKNNQPAAAERYKTESVANGEPEQFFKQDM